ncbi:shikimate dehydrogenase family protein [Variovorax terrae]|uniref:shikimate dehydrogenase (NADP(+)) n=1 Tax=Variovorax terrae TaxID=2923278 RepID=A0A9X1VZT0_9BURK|nr:ThiF family adenylyltransferase [Variovorax terrae]MCJ0765909.1 shikimate dehydrogenase [Variovorax terrae]
MLKGSTQLVAIVGTPIAQVKSPENFNAWFEREQQDLAMIAMDVRAPDLGHCIALMRGWNNLRGCVVTVPYKQAFAAQIDGLSARSAALRAVNVVRREPDGRLVGDMVDGFGFLNAARQHRFRAAGRQALVVGAGGVGGAIAHALCEAGIARLALMDTDAARQDSLAALLAQAFPAVELLRGCASLADFDLVVNATPVGMGGTGELPLPRELLDSLRSDALAADVVTSPPVTPFLELARARGCRIQTGAEMARAQLEFLGGFIGVMPPVDPAAVLAAELPAG